MYPTGKVYVYTCTYSVHVDTMYVHAIEITFYMYVHLYSLCSSRLGPAGGMWYRELSRGVGQVWEIQHIAVTLEGTQSRPYTLFDYTLIAYN